MDKIKNVTRLIDACEYNSVCFSDLLTEVRRIIENQSIMVEILLKILSLLEENRSDTILKTGGKNG